MRPVDARFHLGDKVKAGAGWGGPGPDVPAAVGGAKLAVLPGLAAQLAGSSAQSRLGTHALSTSSLTFHIFSISAASPPRPRVRAPQKTAVDR